MKNNVRVAIAGIGSCASSIIQLVSLAKEEMDDKLSGIAYLQIGDYKVNDIEFVCAFDVDKNKLGLDLSEAIFIEPNKASEYVKLHKLNTIVEPGPLLDGLEQKLENVVWPHEKSYYSSVDYVVKKLQESKADVLVCLTPSGSSQAVRAYALAALKAKVAFINATSEVISRDSNFQREFEEAGVPLLGDEIKGSLGATTLHKTVIELMQAKGIEVTNSYQLNHGGNMNFFNLSNSNHSTSKQFSTRESLSPDKIDGSNLVSGQYGYVEYLEDKKVSYMRLEGKSILNSPISMEVRLEVEDSPNSAGIIVDAIRCAKLAERKGIRGVVREVCPMLFKKTTNSSTEYDALKLFNYFVNNRR